MNFKSEDCTFVGYSPFHKGFKCLTPFGKLIISRHVLFNENSFPFSAKSIEKDLHVKSNPNPSPVAQPHVLFTHTTPYAPIESVSPVQIANTGTTASNLPSVGTNSGTIGGDGHNTDERPALEQISNPESVTADSSVATKPQY